MTYTNEEITIIKNNLKKIEEYCKNEILPQTPEGISVGFNEIHYRSDGSSFTKTYGFRITRAGTPIFRSSALKIVIDEKHEATESSVNGFVRWQYGVELLEKWHIVKTKLHEEIKEQQFKKSSLLNFQI